MSILPPARKILPVKNKSLLVALTASFSVVAVFNPESRAGIVTTNFASGFFNTNSGYEALFSVDGQPNYPNPTGWQTTDPVQAPQGGTNIGATTIVQGYTYYTLGDYTTNGNNSVLFGGYNAPLATPNRLVPGVTNPSIYYNFNNFGAASESTTLSVDFALRRAIPQGTFTNKDSFSFTLWDSFGTTQIASFAFNGMAPWVSANATNYGFQWFDASNTWQSNSPSLTATNWSISLQTIYRLNVVLTNTGTFDVTLQTLQAQLDVNDYVTNYALIASTPFITGGSLGGYAPGDFSSFSIDWELASGNAFQPGSNFMVLNQVNVTSTVVPEPGTWAAGAALLALTALALRRRRALVASK